MGKVYRPQSNTTEHGLVAWRLSGWIGIDGTWSPSFPGSATNLTPRGARQPLVFRSIMDKKQVPLLCPQRFIPPSWLGSEQAEGPRIGRQGRKARPGPGRPRGKQQQPQNPRREPGPQGVASEPLLGSRVVPAKFIFYFSLVSSLIKLLAFSFSGEGLTRGAQGLRSRRRPYVGRPSQDRQHVQTRLQGCNTVLVTCLGATQESLL